jgi:hypothetical protein
MTSDKKKLAMLGIIVVCFGLAVGITVYRRHKEGSVPRGIESIKRGDMTWVKCDNAACEAEYQMDKRDYFEYLEANPPTAEQFVAMMSGTISQTDALSAGTAERKRKEKSLAGP